MVCYDVHESGKNSYGRILAASNKKYLFGPSSKEKDNIFFDNGVGALCKVLKAYMGGVGLAVQNI